jgi:hypothetical protein
MEKYNADLRVLVGMLTSEKAVWEIPRIPSKR